MSEKLLSYDDKYTEFPKYEMIIISDIRDNARIHGVVSFGCTETHTWGRIK